MGLFRRQQTTQGLYLGKPEAEAERQSMLEYFEDYFGIEESIEHGSFIISGRKGSGKSAYAVWMQQNSIEREDLLCSLVLKSEFDLEAIINTLPAESSKFEALFEWIILVRLVKMILESNTGNYLSQYSALKKFYDRNAGYVNIDKYSIVEIVNNSEVNFAPLKSNFGFFNKVFGSKSIKAPFYQMINPLRDTVTQVLRMPIFKDLKFYVMFDDLDVKLKLNREQDKVMLLDLIRVARRYNNEFLSDTTAKVLVFLRDDIGDRLSGTDADKNKIFSSYEHCINWYEHDIAVQDETQVLLRRFINKRLSCAFEKLGYEYNVNDPWLSFVFEDGHQKTSFKYILDHTFYLPRDILSIFKGISKKNLRLPLSHNDVNALLKEYAPIRQAEIRDELCVMIDDNAIVDRLFKVLGEVSDSGDASFHDILCMLERSEIDVSYFSLLIEYSLLVPIDSYNRFYFNYREQAISRDFDKYTYTLPKILKLYFNVR